MKLGGFALKKAKRAALAAPAAFASAAVAPKPEAGKVFVTAFDPAAPAELAADGQPPLVIPLVRTNEWQRPVADDDEEREGKEAARVQDGRASPSSPPLAIPMAGRAGRQDSDQDRAAKRAALFQDGDTRRRTEGQKPILQQNAVPGMTELADVTDKYRHDVALRPEAPDVHSDVYESVPVEAFGAALLRGMGWTGSVDADDAGVAPQPRHKLLGLGATKRPPAPGDDRKRRKKSKTSRKEEKAADAPARPPGLRGRTVRVRKHWIERDMWEIDRAGRLQTGVGALRYGALLLSESSDVSSCSGSGGMDVQMPSRLGGPRHTQADAHTEAE
ncbi:hypothetical protein BBJ28_00015839 [Nothophytophthora sp. Chile5]|nr:hypothetical protein BBJ28_00015839 [Nothophytophthora sp. Chile5]